MAQAGFADAKPTLQDQSVQAVLVWVGSTQSVLR
jgi:hypothetical protein